MAMCKASVEVVARNDITELVGAGSKVVSRLFAFLCWMLKFRIMGGACMGGGENSRTSCSIGSDILYILTLFMYLASDTCNLLLENIYMLGCYFFES